MIFRVTSKISKKIKVQPEIALDRHPNPFLDWTMHAFIAQRLQYVIATHSESLLSCVYYGKGITNQDSFMKRSVESINECLLNYDFNFVATNVITPNADRIVFSKVGDRKINGCMNDLIYHAKTYLEYENLSPLDITRKLNKIPQCTKKYSFPVKAFGRLQAHQGN